MREIGTFLEMEEDKDSGNDFFNETVVESWEALRQKEQDFSDTYSLKQIEENLEYVRKREGVYSRRPKEAVRLEYCLMEGIGSWDWLGPEAEVVPASRYDDVIGGIDFIICFPREGRASIKLSIDVTTSEDIEVLREKVRTIGANLKRGSLAEAKYFSRSEDSQEPKGRTRLPKVVIGTDRENTNLLFAKFCEALKAKKEKGERLVGEPIQFELLRQIKKQLSYFLEIAVRKFVNFTKNKNHEDKELANLLLPLEAMQDLSKEILSPELANLLSYLEKNQEELFRLDSHLAENIFSHFEVMQAIDEVLKEKELPTQAPEALSITEEELEMLNGKVAV